MTRQLRIAGGSIELSTDVQTLSASTPCVDPNPASTLTDRLNIALNTSGSGYILSLCPSTIYLIEAPILFFAPNQEINTQGYPTGDDRAILVVNGPVFNGSGHTTAVDGTCSNCDGVKLRNVQINGTRAGAPPLNGGANIEFGGPNSDQLIEYVHSWDPRSWSCLHVAEGSLNCNNVIVQNNDIGPAGSDAFQQWADGISFSCQNGIVRNNMINNPTDGGIVLFGSPGTQVYNNTIWVQEHTLLGGINMVDYEPFLGNYTGTVVYNNTIMGPFSTSNPTGASTDGNDVNDVMLKIGVAIGPATWFGDYYGTNVSFGGVVRDNLFTGAFGYGIAMSSALDFTVEGNTLFGNYTFIGFVGPNCTTGEAIPTPQAFVVDPSNSIDCTYQPDTQNVSSGNGLTCILPPPEGDFWPYGGNPGNSTSVTRSGSGSAGQADTFGGTSSDHGGIGIGVGVGVGVVVIAIGTWFVRKWAIKRRNDRHLYNNARGPYVRSTDRL